MTASAPAETGSDHPGILFTWREAPSAARALLAGVFVNRLGAFIQIFLVLFLTTRGFTPVQAGFALGIYGAGSVVGVLVGGELTDRLGSRRTILLSMSGTAMMVLAVLYLRNYAALLVAVALVGAVSQAFRPASASLLSELTPKHRQLMIFAMYRLAFNLGSTAAPLIGAGLLAVSYDLLFWGEAVAALGYAVIAAIALPRRNREPAEPDAPATPAAAKEAGPSYLAVLADRRYVLFLLALFLNAVVYMQYISTLPVAMKAAGLATGWFSAMVALNGFIVITCELLATKVVQRWPMRVAAVIGFALLGGGLAIYAIPLGVAVFIVGTLVWSLAEIVGGPTMQAYPAIAGPERLRGRYIGSSSAMFGLGSAIGPVVGLAMWDQVGKAVWLWYGVAGAVGLALAWYGIRPKTTEAEAEAPAVRQPKVAARANAVTAAVKAAVKAATARRAVAPTEPATAAQAAGSAAAKAAEAAAKAAQAAASAASAAAKAAAKAAEAAAKAAQAAASAASAAAKAAEAATAAVASALTAAPGASTPDTAVTGDAVRTLDPQAPDTVARDDAVAPDSVARDDAVAPDSVARDDAVAPDTVAHRSPATAAPSRG